MIYIYELNGEKKSELAMSKAKELLEESKTKELSFYAELKPEYKVKTKKP